MNFWEFLAWMCYGATWRTRLVMPSLPFIYMHIHTHTCTRPKLWTPESGGFQLDAAAARRYIHVQGIDCIHTCVPSLDGKAFRRCWHAALARAYKPTSMHPHAAVLPVPVLLCTLDPRTSMLMRFSGNAHLLELFKLSSLRRNRIERLITRNTCWRTI